MRFRISATLAAVTALLLAALSELAPARAEGTPSGGTDLVLVLDASATMQERDPEGMRFRMIAILLALADERVGTVSATRFAGRLETDEAGDAVLERWVLPGDAKARHAAIANAALRIEKALEHPIGEGCDLARALGGRTASLLAPEPGRRKWLVLLTARDTLAAIESRGRIHPALRRAGVPPETVALEELRERALPSLDRAGVAATILLLDPPGAARTVAAPLRAIADALPGSGEVIAARAESLPTLALDALADAPAGLLGSVVSREFGVRRVKVDAQHPVREPLTRPAWAAATHRILLAPTGRALQTSFGNDGSGRIRLPRAAKDLIVHTLDRGEVSGTGSGTSELGPSDGGGPVEVLLFDVHVLAGEPRLSIEPGAAPGEGGAIRGRVALVGPDGAPLASGRYPADLEADVIWERGAARASTTSLRPPLEEGRAEARFSIPLPADAPLGEYRIRARFRGLREEVEEGDARRFVATPLARAEVSVGGAIRPEAPATVLVLDVSGSMRGNDPDGASVEAAALVSALVEEGEGLASVVFSSRAEGNGPLRAIRRSDDRRAFAAELDGLNRGGETNFVAALARARETLDGAGASRDPDAPAGRRVIVFLTDGEHNTGGDEAAVLAEVERCRARGFSIHAIAYGPEGRTPLLAEMAARTGGAVHVASDARAVLEAYVRIMGQLEDLFISRDQKPVQLLPGARRLITVVLKGAPETRLAAITRDGAPVPLEGERAHRFPATGRETRTVEAVRLEDPAPGVYAARVEGPHEIGMTLCRTAHRFAFAAGAPASPLREGEEQRVTLVVSGPGAWRAFSGASARARVTRLDGSLVAELPLAVRPPDGPDRAPAQGVGADDDARFVGAFRPRGAGGARPEQHLISAELRVVAGETVWTHECATSYTLLPEGLPATGAGGTPGPGPGAGGTTGSSTAGSTGGIGGSAGAGAPPPPAPVKLAPLRVRADRRGYTPVRYVDTEAGGPRAVSVTIERGDLRPVSGTGRPIRADEVSLFVEGVVDGHRLDAGAKVVLRARVYVSQDRAPGVYAGTARVLIRDAETGALVRTLELPIEVDVPK